MNKILSLLIGWGLDLLLGDPQRWPHPVVWFGKAISFCEHRLNKGNRRKLKGAIVSVTLSVAVFCITSLVRSMLSSLPYTVCVVFDSLVVFYCLDGTTLIREVRQVFLAVVR